jgi:serine protease inhibitor
VQHKKNRTKVWLQPAHVPPASGAVVPASSTHDYSPVGDSECFRLINFGQNLLKRCLKSPQFSDKDMFVSPISVASALSMVANGALVGSSVSTAFEQLLGCGPAAAHAAAWFAVWNVSGDTSVRLIMANSLWTKSGVRPEYIASVQSKYDSDCNVLTGPEAINAWVDSKTHGLIQSIVLEVPPDEKAVMVNAMYFKAGLARKVCPDLR